MAMKKTLKAAATLLLAAGLVLTGCPTNGGDDKGNGGDIGVGGLPPLGSGDLAKGENILLKPGYNMTATDVSHLSYAPTDTEDGVESWKVEDGYLSFELEKELGPQNLDSASGLLELLGDDGSAKWHITVNGAGTQGLAFDGFGWIDGNDRYEVSRNVIDTDDKTYQKYSRIAYIYMDDAVTLSRGEVEKSEPGHGIYTFKAFRLELKKGWNLVQEDITATFYPTMSNTTNYNYTTAIKIADKNVPWTVERYNGNDSRVSKGFFGKNR